MGEEPFEGVEKSKLWRWGQRVALRACPSFESLEVGVAVVSGFEEAAPLFSGAAAEGAALGFPRAFDAKCCSSSAIMVPTIRVSALTQLSPPYLLWPGPPLCSF